MPSFKANILAIIVSLMGVKRMWEPERLARTIAKDREKGPAQPTADVTKRFLVCKESVNGQDVFTVSPNGRTLQRRILYLHGGGFVMSITQPHWDFIVKIADLLDAAVTIPIYPLAPEYGIDDTLAAILPIYTSLVQEHRETLTIMGDSSGGNLALLVSMIARDERGLQAAQIVLISPGLDFTFSNPVQVAIDRRDPILSLRGMKKLGSIHAGGYDLRDPKISPLFGNLSGLAPMAVFTGTRDITNPDAHILREKLIKIGSPPVFFEYLEMMHVWPLFPLPEADRAHRQIAEFVRHCEHHHRANTSNNRSADTSTSAEDHARHGR